MRYSCAPLSFHCLPPVTPVFSLGQQRVQAHKENSRHWAEASAHILIRPGHWSTILHIIREYFERVFVGQNTAAACLRFYHICNKLVSEAPINWCENKPPQAESRRFCMVIPGLLPQSSTLPKPPNVLPLYLLYEGPHMGVELEQLTMNPEGPPSPCF